MLDFRVRKIKYQRNALSYISRTVRTANIDKILRSFHPFSMALKAGIDNTSLNSFEWHVNQAFVYGLGGNSWVVDGQQGGVLKTCETTWTNTESWTSHSPGWNVLDVMKALEVGELGV